VQSLIKYWAGSLGRYAEHMSKMRDALNLENIQEKIQDASKDIAGKALRLKEGRILIKGSGTTRSVGLPSLFNRLDYADSLIT